MKDESSLQHILGPARRWCQGALAFVLLAILLLGGCSEEEPARVWRYKVKNTSAHPIKLSYYFFIRNSYETIPLVERIDPGDTVPIDFEGPNRNVTFVLIAECLDDCKPKQWFKLVGRTTRLDEGRTFEIKERHVQPPGHETGKLPLPTR